jgi:hypothetical protein
MSNLQCGLEFENLEGQVVAGGNIYSPRTVCTGKLRTSEFSPD